MNRIYVSLLLLLLPFSFLQAQSFLSEEIEAEIKRRVDLGINPCIAIGIIDSSGNELYYNYGSYGKNQEVDHTTLFEIGSVSKTFTAFLAGKSLEMDAKLGDYFEVKHQSTATILLSELRNHKSGLARLSPNFDPEDWSDPFKDYSLETLKSEIRDIEIDSSKKFEYSNLGYMLLGTVLEMEQMQNYDSLLLPLLASADMNHSFLKHDLAGKKLAEPHHLGVESQSWHFKGPSRYAGGIISCTQDLISYLKFQSKFNPLFLADSISEAVETGISPFGIQKLTYKNGWFIFSPDPQREILLHNGGTGGYNSFLAYDKSNGQAVAVLSNSMSLIDVLALKMIYPAVEMKRPQLTVAYKLAQQIKDGKTDDLVGDYQKFVEAGEADDLIQIYWLERLHFGKANFEISNQLSDIMLLSLADDWEVLDLKAQNLEQLGEFEKAADYYQKALKLYPEKTLLKQKIKRCKEQL